MEPETRKRNYRQSKRKSDEEIICLKSAEEGEEEKGKKTRKRQSKRQQQQQQQQKDEEVVEVVDEALRLKRRTRYLLIKMKRQQNLIDAYATEGWKGQSREKIRPDKELERARKEILNCKLGLRDAIRQLDLLSSVGSFEKEVMAPDGSIHHDHIFCAECNSREAFLDNDIILCDGTCNRAFHQMCLDPPLKTENIPPGDQGWFCKICDCKMEIIDSMNAQIGTNFPMDSYWKDIFFVEASLPNGADATVNNEEDWPSDDSEDDDYDPEMKEKVVVAVGSYISSDGGEGGESDGEDSSSSSVSLASDDGVGVDHGFSNTVESCDEETVCGPRQRSTVDYTKLYHEMFGKEAGLQEQGSEDEDWGPNERRKRRKESDAVVTLCENSKKGVVEEIREHSEREGKGGRRTLFRLPKVAIERLRQVFAEDELPSKAVRDSLSEELSIDNEKISKWFKNARYMACRNRKAMEMNKETDEALETVEETVREENTQTVEETAEETVMEENTETVEETAEETIMEENMEANEVLDTVEETVMEENTEAVEETAEETIVEENTEANEVLDTLEETQQPHEEVSSEEEEEEVERKMTEEEEFEAVMEMICRAENRLLDVTKRIEKVKPQKGRKKGGKSSSSLHEDDSVVYVPIAVIKE